MNHAWSYRTAKSNAPYFFLTIYDIFLGVYPDVMELTSRSTFVFRGNKIDRAHLELMCLFDSSSANKEPQTNKIIGIALLVDAIK